MSSIGLALQVVFPMLCLLALGYGLKQMHIVGDITLREMNILVFKVFLPCLIFKNIYQSNLQDEFDLFLLFYASGAVILVCIVAGFLVTRFEKDNSKASVMTQGIYRSNFVLFGILVATSIYGEDNLGMTTILAAVVVPIFNILAVVIFELFRGGKLNIATIFKGIITNSIILSSVIGIIFLIGNIPVPMVLMGLIKDLAGIATPMALIVLGGTFTFAGMHKYAKELIFVAIGRLVAVPAICVGFGILFGYRGVDLVALMVLFASPTAVASFTMAEQMGGNGELAGQIVVVTSALSVLTIFLWIFGLSFFQLT